VDQQGNIFNIVIIMGASNLVTVVGTALENVAVLSQAAKMVEKAFKELQEREASLVEKEAMYEARKKELEEMEAKWAKKEEEMKARWDKREEEMRVQVQNWEENKKYWEAMEVKMAENAAKHADQIHLNVGGQRSRQLFCVKKVHFWRH